MVDDNETYVGDRSWTIFSLGRDLDPQETEYVRK